MNENLADGAVKSGVGKLENGLGRTTGDDRLQGDGVGAHIEGQAQRMIGSAQDAVNQVADGAKEAVTQAGDRARDLYGRAQDRVKTATGTVEPFLRDQPYTALGLAAAGGLLIGLLLAGRGPKVIYVKPSN